jgi:hypothetical protein
MYNTCIKTGLEHCWLHHLVYELIIGKSGWRNLKISVKKLARTRNCQRPRGCTDPFQLYAGTLSTGKSSQEYRPELQC